MKLHSTVLSLLYGMYRSRSLPQNEDSNSDSTRLTYSVTNEEQMKIVSWGKNEKKVNLASNCLKSFKN